MLVGVSSPIDFDLFSVTALEPLNSVMIFSRIFACMKVFALLLYSPRLSLWAQLGKKTSRDWDEHDRAKLLRLSLARARVRSISASDVIDKIICCETFVLLPRARNAQSEWKLWRRWRHLDRYAINIRIIQAKTCLETGLHRMYSSKCIHSTLL
jgi:hypothetical protein